MSEQAPNPTPPAGPTPEQIDVEAAFDPEARQAQAKMDIYTENRPYQDANGAVHDPANGNFINPDEYFDEQHQIAKDNSQTAYEDMSIPALAHKLGEAEHYGDKTTEQSVTDVLLEKMGAEEARIANSGGTETGNRQDNLWDSVMAAKDLKKRQLEKKNGGKESAGEKSADSDKGERKSPDEDLDSEFDQVLDEDPEKLKEDLKNAENMPSDHMFHARGKQVVWGPDKDGMVQRGLEFRGQKMHKVRGADGRIHVMPEVISWDKVPYMQGENREVILRAYDRENNRNYTSFIKGDKMYEIVNEDYGEPQIRVVDLAGSTLPDMAIGRPLAWADRGLELYSVQVKSPAEKTPMYRQLKGRELEKSYQSEIDAIQGQIDQLVEKKAKIMGVDPSEIDRARAGLELTKRGVMGLRSVADQGRERLFTGTHQGLRGNDPFEELEAKINGASSSQPSEKLEDIIDDEQPTTEIPVVHGEAGEQRGGLEEGIRGFTERFQDKTYVPSPEEYQQMRELAGRIRIDYGDESGKKPIRYLNVDGGQLNAKATRDFLDHMKRRKWILKEKEAAVASDLYDHATPINIKRLDLPQRTRRDWLSFQQFMEQKQPGAEGSGTPSQELVNQYREYISKRIQLSEALSDGDGNIVTPEELVMGSLKDFARQQRRERARSRPGAMAGRAGRNISRRIRR